jgi:hypothetical protein
LVLFIIASGSGTKVKRATSSISAPKAAHAPASVLWHTLAIAPNRELKNAISFSQRQAMQRNKLSCRLDHDGHSIAIQV